MAMSLAQPSLRDYLAIVWRRKWSILAVTLTTTVVAVFYAARQTPLYVSSAEVIVRGVRFDPSQPSGAFAYMNMKTEAQVANSQPVARRAWAIVGGKVPVADTTATNVEGTETIQFSSTSPNPAAAQITANAYARAYLEFRRDSTLHELGSLRARYESSLQAVAAQLRDAAEQIGKSHNAGQTAILTARYQSLLSRQSTLQGKLGDLVTPEDLSVGQLLKGAGLPTAPANAGEVRAAILGILLGLVLGIAMAVFRDRLDDRMRGRAELELRSGAPVFAFIPRSGAKRGPVTLIDPTSDAAEAYKGLRVRLLHAATQHPLKAVVVTSSAAEEGKTTTVANLGVALALAGKRVVLLSADLRRPGLQRYFPPSPEQPGLSDVLVDHRGAMDGLMFSGTENLWVLHAGSPHLATSPLELLGGDAMARVMTELRSLADFVLVDTSPMMTTSDVAALGPLVDGVLFVVDPRRAQRAMVEQARHDLEMNRVPIVGVVVNKFDARTFRVYGPGTGYGYGYGYPPDRDEAADRELNGVHSIVPLARREGN
jgi:capsular exopolysaccharide synthesis family protein